MAVIYLVHPRHGAKVAISEEEANYDEMFGWERYDLPTPQAVVETSVDEDENPVNVMVEPKRRGRRRAPQED